jgi:hypothetical protein
MKKFLLVLAALAMVAGSVFAAELFKVGETGTVGLDSWGRTQLDLLTVKDDNTDDDIDAVIGNGIGPAWDGAGLPRINAKVVANLGAVGFTGSMFFKADGSAVGSDNENTNVWLKPFGDIVELKFGGFNEDIYRGTNGNTFLDFYNGEFLMNDVFNRFATQGSNNFQLKIAPVAGLNIIWNTKLGQSDPTVDGMQSQFDAWAMAIAYSRVAVGYDIANIGTFRLGYFGDGIPNLKDGDKVKIKSPAGYYDTNSPGKIYATIDEAIADGVALTDISYSKGDTTWTEFEMDEEMAASTITANEYIQAAFKLTAVEGLTLDLGAKIPLADKKYVGSSVGINLTGSYAADALNISFGLGLGLGNPEGEGEGTDSGVQTPMTFKANVAPSYNLGSFTAGASIGFDYTGKSSKDGKDSKISFMAVPGVQIPIAGTTISTGVALKFDTADSGVSGSKAVNGMEMSIPIRFDYAF